MPSSNVPSSPFLSSTPSPTSEQETASFQSTTISGCGVGNEEMHLTAILRVALQLARLKVHKMMEEGDDVAAEGRVLAGAKKKEEGWGLGRGEERERMEE